MERYCVNENSDEHGYHEVHKVTCDHLPEAQKQYDLGYCSSCHAALVKAEQRFSQVDGCYFCCYECHKH